MSSSKNKTITYYTIVMNHADMYKNASECAYDMIVSDFCEDGVDTIRDLFCAFGSPHRMLQAIKDGHAVMMLGDKFTQVENLVAAKAPFVLIILKEGKLWLAVNHFDIQY